MGEDRRLYVVEPGWKVAIKADDGQPLYCFLKSDDAEGYPRIAAGEIYVTNDVETYNLNSAIQKGIVSTRRPTLEGRTPRWGGERTAGEGVD
jgi:hypothetical protein